LGGGQAQPGGKGLDRGPPLPLQAEFGDERLDGEHVHAIDRGQVHTRPRLEVAAHIEGGGMALGCVPSALAWREGLLRAVDLGCEGRVLLRNRLVTGGDVLMVKVGQFQGLRARNEMGRPVVAGEGVGHGLFARGAVRMPIGGQRVGIALTTDHGTEDRKPRQPGAIAAHVGQLHVQQVPGLLPMRHRRRTGAEHGGARAEVSPPGTPVFGGAKGPAPPPVGRELVQPGAVQHVRLAAWDMLQVPGSDSVHGTATGLEDFRPGDPIHARRFHGHRGDAPGRQPVGHGITIDGTGLETPHGWCIAGFRHTGVHVTGTDSSAGRLPGEVLQVLPLADGGARVFRGVVIRNGLLRGESAGETFSPDAVLMTVAYYTGSPKTGHPCTQHPSSAPGSHAGAEGTLGATVIPV